MPVKGRSASVAIAAVIAVEAAVTIAAVDDRRAVEPVAMDSDSADTEPPATRQRPDTLHREERTVIRVWTSRKWRLGATKLTVSRAAATTVISSAVRERSLGAEARPLQSRESSHVSSARFA